MLESTDEAIGELSASDLGFTYVPTGEGVEMVVIIPEMASGAALPNGTPSNAPPAEAITRPDGGSRSFTCASRRDPAHDGCAARFAARGDAGELWVGPPQCRSSRRATGST